MDSTSKYAKGSSTSRPTSSSAVSSSDVKASSSTDVKASSTDVKASSSTDVRASSSSDAKASSSTDDKASSSTDVNASSSTDVNASSSTDEKASSSTDIKASSDSTPVAGPSQEVAAKQTPRPVRPRLSRDALAARAFAARATAMPISTTSSDLSSTDESSSDNDKPTPKAEFKSLVRPTSRVARARILFADAKHTIVREAVMPDKVTSEVYYNLMGKSFINLKDILNKTINLRINSPSPIIPRKRRSSVAGSASKFFDKPSKKAKKIII